MKHYLELHEVKGSQQVNISCDGLRSHAYDWWKQLKMDKKHRGKGKIQTWEKMVIKLRGKYVSSEYTLRMCRSLEKLKKNDRCVESYFEYFCRMAMRASFVPNSEEEIIQFVDGLRLSITRKIYVEKMWSLEEACHLALRIEKWKLKKTHGSK